jgi:hypothetical protein
VTEQIPNGTRVRIKPEPANRFDLNGIEGVVEDSTLAGVTIRLPDKRRYRVPAADVEIVIPKPERNPHTHPVECHNMECLG